MPWVTKDARGLLGVPGVTKGARGLLGVPGVTRGVRGLLGVQGAAEVILERFLIKIFRSKINILEC